MIFMKYSTFLFVACLVFSLISVGMVFSASENVSFSTLSVGDDVTALEAADAESDIPTDASGPLEVHVGLYVLNLGKFDVSSGTYTADFYMSLRCDVACDPQFEFMNGRASSVEKITDEPNLKFYRIQANLNNRVDLKQFPFDSQRLTILLEDKKLTVDKLVYIADLNQSGIDPSIAFTGWELKGYDATVTTHDYPLYGEVYSQYEFGLPISRIMWNSFLKTFLPVIFIVLIVLFSFILDPDKVSTRLGMAGSALIAAVMFHISITNQIPPVGYLTFADKFMALTYFVLLVAFVINIAILELQERKKTELVEKIHRRTEFAMFILVPVLYVLLFFLGF